MDILALMVFTMIMALVSVFAVGTLGGNDIKQEHYEELNKNMNFMEEEFVLSNSGKNLVIISSSEGVQSKFFLGDGNNSYIYNINKAYDFKKDKDYSVFINVSYNFKDKNIYYVLNKDAGKAIDLGDGKYMDFSRSKYLHRPIEIYYDLSDKDRDSINKEETKILEGGKVNGTVDIKNYIEKNKTFVDNYQKFKDSGGEVFLLLLLIATPVMLYFLRDEEDKVVTPQPSPKPKPEPNKKYNRINLFMENNNVKRINKLIDELNGSSVHRFSNKLDRLIGHYAVDALKINIDIDNENITSDTVESLVKIENILEKEISEGVDNAKEDLSVINTYIQKHYN